MRLFEAWRRAVVSSRWRRLRSASWAVSVRTTLVEGSWLGRATGTGCGRGGRTERWCSIRVRMAVLRVGAELVIRGGDLRHRCTVAVGHDVGRGGTTAVSDLPTSDGLAGTADAQRSGC